MITEAGVARERLIEIGGGIRKIAIVTIRENSCACYLARRLRATGAEIAFFNQTDLKVETRSREYFLRLWRKRGLANALDNLALYAAVLARGAFRRSGASGYVQPAPLPVMADDPALRHESWLTWVDIRDVNSDEGRGAVAAFAPDVMLLGGAPILGRRAITLPRVACINPHCGITPDYCGGSPPDWALYEGRFSDIGYTIHLVEPIVDSGPVIWQERLDWDPDTSITAFWPMLAQGMYDKLAEIGAGLVEGRRYRATPQGPPRVLPPAGLVVKAIADWRRRRFARAAALTRARSR